MQLIFQNNVKGTHTATVFTTNNVVLDLGEDITIPKQPVRGGVGRQIPTSGFNSMMARAKT